MSVLGPMPPQDGAKVDLNPYLFTYRDSNKDPNSIFNRLAPPDNRKIGTIYIPKGEEPIVFLGIRKSSLHKIILTKCLHMTFFTAMIGASQPKAMMHRYRRARTYHVYDRNMDFIYKM